MWETWVWSLGWEDPLEKGNLPTPVFWSGKFHGLCSPWVCKESDITERLSFKVLQFWWQFIVIVGQVLGHLNKAAQKKAAWHPLPVVKQCSVEMGFTPGPCSSCSLCLWCSPLSLHMAGASLSPKTHPWRSFSWSLSLKPLSLPIPIPSVILYPHGLASKKKKFIAIIKWNYLV